MTGPGRAETSPRTPRAPIPRLAEELRGRPLPLSFAQERLWFLAELDPGGCALNAPFALALRGALDRDALHRALHAIVRRHEALRTSFAQDGGRPVQRVAADVDVALPVDDLSALPGAERAAAAQRLAHCEFHTGFDLEAGPVFRLRLVRLAGDDHRLLLVVHHIAWDAWSAVVFVRELGALYQAFTSRAEPAQPELAVQVPDVAAWQRATLDDAALGEHLAYWRDRLAGAPPVLELPADRPRPAVASLRGARIRRALPAELADALRAFAAARGVTPFIALVAGFAALLARYTGLDDLVLGSAMAGRTRRELEPLLGMFVNAVPLRLSVSGDPSFDELVARARTTCLGALAHQDLPFERIVGLAAPVRDPSRMPVFQVFIGQRPAWPTLELPGLVLDTDDGELDASLYDLSLHLQDTAAPAAITATWEYSTTLFDAATIERMAGHWTRLLAAAVAEPGRRITELAMVPEAERRALLADGNPPAEPPPAATCLHELFEAQVDRTPAAAAVVLGDTQLSYRELDRRASRIARRLRAIGAGVDARICICTADPLDAIIAVLGILKAGAAYVALDPAYPAERLRYLVGDVRPLAVLGPPNPAFGDVAVLPVDDPAAAGDRDGDALDERTRVPGDALAYIIYTSGSTGRPKGVMISHRAVVQRLAHAQRFFGLAAGDTGLAAASLGFDASVLEIFTTLASGARLALIAPADRADPERLAAAYAAAQVSFAFVVPSVLAALLDTGLAAAPRQLVCGGEALPGHVRDRWLARSPSLELTNCYGPTECTIYVTLHTFPAADAGTPVVLGRPLGASRGYVLDRRLEPVPVGAIGEIWVGGGTLARGYLDRAALTAERFVPDPFAAAGPGARMYRTGDLGRWRADGRLEYLGRVDHQVKLRGVRIELGEIEAVLCAQPDIAEAVVVVRDDTGDPRLVAYAVPRAGAALDLDAARARLAEVLPRYLVPGAIVALDRLPLGANGKLDRRALPAPSARRVDLGGDYLAPEGDLEHAISEIWAGVLGVDRVGANDNFFDLGGSSFLLAQVRARIEARLGRSVPMVVLLQCAQVRSLAAHLAGVAEVAPAEPAPPSTGRAEGARRLAGQRRGRDRKPDKPAEDA